MRDAPLSMRFTEGAAACSFQIRVHKIFCEFRLGKYISTKKHPEKVGVFCSENTA
jgi:hypothetical protein